MEIHFFLYGLLLQVLLVSFVLSIIKYGLMVILGYLMFGKNLTSQITLNLPKGKISSKIAIYTIQINPLTMYAIVITFIANAIEDTFSFINRRHISITIRRVRVINTIVLVVTIQFFLLCNGIYWCVSKCGHLYVHHLL